MNCQDIKKLLIPFLESDLSESEKTAVEAHLHKCDDCQKEKVLLEKSWSMLDGFQAPQVSSNFAANLMVRIHEEEGVRPEFGVRILVPAMASVCILIAVYMIAQYHPLQKQLITEEAILEQAPTIQMEEAVSVKPEVKISEVAPVIQKEDAKTVASDEEIIRNLDVYKNIELYQNYSVISDLDVVENVSLKGI